MKLRFSPTSPYVRKVRIVALETGLDDRIERIATNAWAPETDLPLDNPLGKVPALITDGGEHLYDSPVICEYLDSLHDGAKLFPAAGGARWTTLRRQALADGIMDAAVIWRLEMTSRPAELRWTEWSERQSRAITRGLDVLEEEANTLSRQITIGEITIVCALGYLDFRWPSVVWRQNRPALAAWYALHEARASVAATVPQG
jgi:glutathione S-transferase